MSDMPLVPLRRCAIYTRKSNTYFLERDVNSLVTQREMCGAYITSQGYRGWVALPESYDDGGHSGSGIERPALIRLMRNIEAGEVDAVVVYKIDRLTRSLVDFVRLVEIFDRNNIALVSISQAFDTSDSMGRMILNVLLTFSQFERELITERVRDSIRTRKRHGRIHGGLPPFGYVATDRGLEVDEPEAEIVRFIFCEFLKTERYTQVMTAVRLAGLRSSVKLSRRGVPRGGGPINPSTVYSILRSPIYVGEIHGHGETYHGRHAPLISRETWERAQELSEARRRKPPDAKRTDHFLAGLLWDDLGRHMLLNVHWHRGKALFTYASTNASWSQTEYRRQYRTQADHLEQLVVAAIADFLADRRKLRAALKRLGLFGRQLEELAASGKPTSALFTATPLKQRAEQFRALVERIEVGEEQLTITVRGVELRRLLQWNGKTSFRGRPADWSSSEARYELLVEVSALSAARWPLMIVHARAATAGKPNPRLVRLIDRARKAQRLLEENRDRSLEELAQSFYCRPAHFSQLIRLNYLAPDIVMAILDGAHPSGLNANALRKANLPTDWAIQRRLLGFPIPERPRAPANLYGRGMWPSAELQS